MKGGTIEPAGAVLYTRRGCPPCFAMRRAARRAARRYGVALRVVEVGGDPDLEARYGRSVPVLVLPDGTAIAGPARAAAVERAFRGAAGVRSGPWWRRWLGALRRGRPWEAG